MREVNFSLPGFNKASVGITTALYDRRALDCTATLPLINSLNHLAYLTTSSARIRDILTVDGGIEKLVVILKQGRSKDLMSMWKWNLAFQCVVNIGVRGSENVRTRVVEADMVPVIATILDNYIQYMERVTKRAQGPQGTRGRESRSSSFAVRRPQAPRSIDIPPPNNLTGPQAYQQLLARHAPHPMSTDARQTFQLVRGPNGLPQPMLSIDFTLTGEYAGIQPVRDADRLLSMTQAGLPSQPASPTTPNPVVNTGGTYQERGTGPRSGRVALRHQRSMSGESDDGAGEVLPAPTTRVLDGNERILDIQSGVDMERDAMLESVEPMAITLPHGGDPQDVAETFNITHRSRIDGSLVTPNGPVNPTMGFSPNQPNVNPALSINGSLQMNSRYTDDGSTSNLPACMPRDEDVLMSLQLLAYVSKYCNLRTYFQKSHLVPRLSIDRELQALDEKLGHRQPRQKQEEEVEEYMLPDDFNIFPLVEKFTVRHHPLDMQYWAGVVMRNLCRKDDSKGGIRQCAYYECGKWEEFTRQFAKCRRCRRTKYCSKECQKSAWVYHRHWCVAAQ